MRDKVKRKTEETATRGANTTEKQMAAYFIPGLERIFIQIGPDQKGVLQG